MRLAHLGPAGTFSEEAALIYAPTAELVPCPSIVASAQAMLRGEADEAITPIENSLQGAVTDTLDLLIHESRYQIKRELNLAVSHNLMAPPGTTLQDIRRVYSHPQALGQCRGWLEANLPGVEVAAALSTAAPAQSAVLAKQQRAVCCGNSRCNELASVMAGAKTGKQERPLLCQRFGRPSRRVGGSGSYCGGIRCCANRCTAVAVHAVSARLLGEG